MKKPLLFLLSFLVVGFVACKEEGTDPEEGNNTEQNGNNNEQNNDPLAVGAVAEVNTGYVVKFTGSQCPPCGSWGWDFMKSVMNTNGDNAIYTAAFSQNFVAKLFITDLASTWDDNLGITGYPTFASSNQPKTKRPDGKVYVADEIAMVNESVAAHKAADVKINTALNYEIKDGKIRMMYKTKSFTDNFDDNYMGIFIQENGVKGYQAGHADGANTIHDHVLRADVNGHWGEGLGSLTVGQEVEGEATIDIDSEWNSANLEVFVVHWKKVGNKYVFQNASKGTLITE